MAIDLSAIYSNPLIDPDHYFARIERVQVQHVGAKKPRIQIDLTLDKNGKEIDGTKLTVILHPTEKSLKHYQNFEETFGIKNAQFEDATGKWGMVYARENLYKGTAHSVIKFHKQTKAAKKRVAKIEAEEAAAPDISDWVA